MKQDLLISVALVAFGVNSSVMAADVAVRMPVKAPDMSSSSSSYDWSGFYVGAHGGYAAGYSRWSATEVAAAMPRLTGSLDFFHAFDGFKGTGSYFIGLQAGYNYMSPSRLLLGVEADVSFPSLIGGAQVMSSDAIGQATYAEIVQFSGTVRGRVGYASAHWLVYATGGFAWTYNQFTRTQLVDTPRAVPLIRARSNLYSSRLELAPSVGPALRSRCRRTGPHGSNISTLITARAA
jgi:high affinity Mn2+ porin